MTKEIQQSQSAYKDIVIPKTKYPNEYMQYCEHCAFPKTMRKYKDDKGFARAYKISPNTLTQWKKTPIFNNNIRMIAKQVIGNDLPLLMDKCKHKALQGDNKALNTILTWLGELENTTNVENNIQFTWVDNTDIKPLTVEAEVVDTIEGS